MTAIPLEPALLARHPLPEVADDADKEDRGRLLVIAGSRELPGAALLAGVAGLRVGAGKLVIATAGSIAPALGLAVPEAWVIGLPETAGLGLVGDDSPALDEALASAGAVLIGPGMMDEPATLALARRVLGRCRPQATVVLDALALCAVHSGDWGERTVLTPHAGEMAHLTGLSKDALQAEPERHAREAAERWQTGVIFKGGHSFVAWPGGDCWQHAGHNPGLATSGSGDTLAGMIAGLAARGASARTACLWGVLLHAGAGSRLAEKHGPLGYLARELLDELPAVMCGLGEFEAPGL